MFDLATSGYPQILPVKNWVSFVSSNNDVGSNFVISKYFPQTKTGQSFICEFHQLQNR